MFVVDLYFIKGDDISCLIVKTDDANLWNRRMGLVSSSLLNKPFAGT